MEKLKSWVPITAQDLNELIIEQTDDGSDHERLQKFLDDTNTGLDLNRMSALELERVRAVVNNPAAALSSPSILIWNNICRQRSRLMNRPH